MNFLVTSNTRKNLLQLLWGEGVKASGRQLALLCDAVYSVVHAELELMKTEGLVTFKRKGKADVYSKNESYLSKKELLMLLGKQRTNKPNLNKVTDADVRVNLAKAGAPVVTISPSSAPHLPLEESLVLGLKLARKDASVARSLPIAFARNKKNLDFAKLEFLARENNVLQVLGLYLDLTASLTKDNGLHLVAQQLMDKRRKKMEPFFQTHTNKYERALAERNTPQVVRDWHFLMNLGMDSFETLFKKNMSESDL